MKNIKQKKIFSLKFNLLFTIVLIFVNNNTFSQVQRAIEGKSIIRENIIQNKPNCIAPDLLSANTGFKIAIG